MDYKWKVRKLTDLVYIDDNQDMPICIVLREKINHINLIAAAPELRSALLELCNAVEGITEDMVGCGKHNWIQEKAEKAELLLKRLEENNGDSET